MDQSHARPTSTTRCDAFVSEELDVLHNLNNQLGIILGQCLLLAQEAKDPRLLKRLETIQRALGRLGDEVAGRQNRIAEIMRPRG